MGQRICLWILKANHSVASTFVKLRSVIKILTYNINKNKVLKEKWILFWNMWVQSFHTLKCVSIVFFFKTDLYLLSDFQYQLFNCFELQITVAYNIKQRILVFCVLQRLNVVHSPPVLVTKAWTRWQILFNSQTS